VENFSTDEEGDSTFSLEVVWENEMLVDRKCEGFTDSVVHSFTSFATSEIEMTTLLVEINEAVAGNTTAGEMDEEVLISADFVCVNITSGLPPIICHRARNPLSVPEKSETNNTCIIPVELWNTSPPE
jgi:hypothetical protein